MQSPTSKTSSAGRKLRSQPRPSARSAGSRQEQTKVSAPGTIANGFLRCSFLPIYEPSAQLPKRSTVEQNILQSIHDTQAFYGTEIIDLKQYGYPYNVLLGLWDLDRKLRKKGRYREIQVIQGDDDKVALTIKETLNMNNTLFYVPVKPLYTLYQSQQYSSCADLLTAIFSYLYVHASMSYYRDEGTYLYFSYEILDNWIEDDREMIDDEDYEHSRKAVDEAFLVGDYIQERIMDKSYLQNFTSSLKAFKPILSFEKETLRLATAFYELWQAYPDANIFSHANQPEGKMDEYYDNESCIGLADYVSFIAADYGCAYDEVINMINTDFNERPAMQEPEVETTFDAPKGEYRDKLGYEDKLFDLIGDLCDLLDDLP